MPPVSPEISVSIITYNQRDVIGRAIDSVLAQEINVPYEIIIGDDCSDDGTQDILRDYQHRFPDRIQLILHPRRYPNGLAGRINNVTNLSCCRGKYTAMLDGDDYWIDTGKLQRQYERLERHPNVAMCLHDSHLVPDGEDLDEERHQKLSNWGSHKESGIYTHRDLAHRLLVAQVSTMMFRTRSFDYFPEWFYRIMAADYALYLLISEGKSVYFDAHSQAVYTYSQSSTSRTLFFQEEILQKRVDDIKFFARHFPVLEEIGVYYQKAAYLHWRLFMISMGKFNLPQAGARLYKVMRCDVEYPARAVIGKVWMTYKKFRNAQ